MVIASSEQVASFFRGSAYRRQIEDRGKVKKIICHPRQRICFLLTDDKTIVKTQIQAFTLQAIEIPGNLWERRLRKVRVMIQERKIKDFSELIEACGKGVILVPISLRWYV